MPFSRLMRRAGAAGSASVDQRSSNIIATPYCRRICLPVTTHIGSRHRLSPSAVAIKSMEKRGGGVESSYSAGMFQVLTSKFLPNYYVH